MRKEIKKNKQAETPTYYGGQAVMEGVMMRGRKTYAMAVRKSDGTIAVIEKPVSAAVGRYPFLKWPLIRGVTALADAMVVGVRSLSQSAEIAAEGITEEGPPSRFEQFLQKKLGDRLNEVLIQVTVVLAVVIAVGLFMLLPAWIGSWFTPLLQERLAFTGVIEGVVRIGIFILYIVLVSRSKDIQRVFQYHGAEHKTINCYEGGGPLDAGRVASFSRLHKRCGTSFMLVVMVISMLAFMFIRTDSLWLRFALRVALLPLIAGISYEISVKWAARHDNWLVRAIIFPGMCLQKLTTAEPDEAQIETAITALNAALARDHEADDG